MAGYPLNSHYVLSAHGGCSGPLGPRFNPPPTLQIVFYSQPGKIFNPKAAVQTKICNDPAMLETYEKAIEELAIRPDQYTTFPTRTGIPKSKSSLNYELTPDDSVPKLFYSGLVCCKCNAILYNIDTSPVTNLENICNIIKGHNDSTHPGTFAHLHYLACRSTEAGDTGTTYLSTTGVKQFAEKPHPPMNITDTLALFKGMHEYETKEGGIVTLTDRDLMNQYDEYKISLTPEYQDVFSRLTAMFPTFTPQNIHKGAVVYCRFKKHGQPEDRAYAWAMTTAKQGGKRRTKKGKKKLRLRTKHKKLKS